MPQRPLPTLRSAGGITTVVVPEQAVSDKAFKQTYADTLANGIASSRTATTCGWIVDLRHNHGGDMGPMLAGLSALLPDGNLVGFKDRSGTVVWETLEGGTVSQGGQVSMAVADAAKLSQPIAVLQGPDNGSSGRRRCWPSAAWVMRAASVRRRPATRRPTRSGACTTAPRSSSPRQSTWTVLARPGTAVRYHPNSPPTWTLPTRPQRPGSTHSATADRAYVLRRGSPIPSRGSPWRSRGCCWQDTR
nr:S41 family peptidase [Tessaracoccus coleopterorum]